MSLPLRPPPLLARVVAPLQTAVRACFDWRASVVAAVLAIGAALLFVSTGIDRRDYYFFDVTLTSSSPGNTQLFWDFGKGYNENDSSRQPLKIEPNPVVYRFMMPMGTMRELRLDPIDGLGFFTFKHARVVDYHGHLIRSFEPEDFTPVQHLARCEKMNDTLVVQTTPDARDPVLLLKLKTPLELKGNLGIWLRLGGPVALRVFLLGLIVGAPAVASRLWRWSGRAGQWAVLHPRAAVVIAAVLAVAVQSHPVIFLGRSFVSPNNGGLMLYGELPTLPNNNVDFYTNTMGSDTGAMLFHHVYFPMVQHEALFKNHELPLWNRYTLCGDPSLGQGQSFFGNPLHFLPIFADGAAWAWDVCYLLAHWSLAAGLGFIVWRLTRHLGSALLVTLSTAFISYFTFRLNHPANFSVCYSPWILWAWVGLIQASTRRAQAGWLFAMVVANWTVMSSGTVKEAYMLIACLNLAGAVLLGLAAEARGRRLQLLGLAAATGIIFLLISAPGWLTFLGTLHHSYTVYDAPWAAPLPLPHFIGFFDDIFYRQTVEGEWVVAPGLNFFLLLGVLWWLVNPRCWREDRVGLAMVLAAIVPFSLAFGIVPPAVIVKIPFLGNIHHVGNTFSCSLLILAVVLAGCGFRDALRQRKDASWWPNFGRMLLAGGGLAVAFFLSTREHVKSPFFQGYASALAVGAVALPAAVGWGARHVLRPGPLVVALLLGLPLLLWRHCQLGETFFNFYAFVPNSRADFYAKSPSVEFVNQHQSEPGRVVGWGNNLFPVYNTALRWEGLYGVETLRSRYYHELTTEFDLKRVWVWDYHMPEKDSAKLVPYHDLLNVTYYVATKAPLPHAIAGLEWLGQQDLDVYRSPTAWPRAFFTDRLAGYATIKDFATMVRDGDRRPFAAMQNSDAPAFNLPTNQTDRTIRPARDYRLTSNTTSFVVDATGPGMVVLTEAYYPEDFQVTINGQPADYFRVNHAFKGVYVDRAGTYTIAFAYAPPVFEHSLVLFAVGLAGLAGGAWWLRRSPTPVPS
jgi:hypothetical protein